jgi:hypothetical protein
MGHCEILGEEEDGRMKKILLSGLVMITVIILSTYSVYLNNDLFKSATERQKELLLVTTYLTVFTGVVTFYFTNQIVRYIRTSEGIK